jgi:hypothetical protein
VDKFSASKKRAATEVCRPQRKVRWHFSHRTQFRLLRNRVLRYSRQLLHQLVGEEWSPALRWRIGLGVTRATRPCTTPLQEEFIHRLHGSSPFAQESICPTLRHVSTPYYLVQDRLVVRFLHGPGNRSSVSPKHRFPSTPRTKFLFLTNEIILRLI